MTDEFRKAADECWTLLGTDFGSALRACFERNRATNRKLATLEEFRQIRKSLYVAATRNVSIGQYA